MEGKRPAKVSRRRLFRIFLRVSCESFPFLKLRKTRLTKDFLFFFFFIFTHRQEEFPAVSIQQLFDRLTGTFASTSCKNA